MEKVDRPNTLIASIPEELIDLSHAEFVDKLMSSLGAEDIDGVQFVPRCYVGVTFKSFDARNNAFLSGIHIETTRPYAVEADPVFKDIHLEHLPVEDPDKLLLQLCSSRHGPTSLMSALAHVLSG